MPKLPQTPEQRLVKVRGALADVLRRCGELNTDLDPPEAALVRLANAYRDRPPIFPPPPPGFNESDIPF